MPDLDGMSHACLHDTHVGTELRTCTECDCTCMCHPQRDSGVRADPPGNAIDAPPGFWAAAKVLHQAGCGKAFCEHTEYDVQQCDYELAADMFAAAAPVIAAQAARDAEHRITQLENALHAYAPYHELLNGDE